MTNEHQQSGHSWVAVMLLAAACCCSAQAQQPARPPSQSPPDRYFPLSQHSPAGQHAHWRNILQGRDPSWLQPLKIEAPGGGRVDIFSGSRVAVGTAVSPARVRANVGHLYRLRISDMPKHPGVELFPTIELIDRLHPPEGHADTFPIPIIFTDADIEAVTRGDLVTRVVYLEQPQLAQVHDPLRRTIPQRVTPNENVLQEADRLGRPMAIIRIGGRRPSTHSADSFFGTGGTIQVAARAESAARPASSPSLIRQTGAAVVRMNRRK